MNIARCIINETNLPKHLWGEIAATSVFLINRLPHKALKGDTPYFRMFGKQANLSFLRIIGSRAFVYIDRKSHFEAAAKSVGRGLGGLQRRQPYIPHIQQDNGAHHKHKKRHLH